MSGRVALEAVRAVPLNPFGVQAAALSVEAFLDGSGAAPFPGLPAGAPGARILAEWTVSADGALSGGALRAAPLAGERAPMPGGPLRPPPGLPPPPDGSGFRGGRGGPPGGGPAMGGGPMGGPPGGFGGRGGR